MRVIIPADWLSTEEVLVLEKQTALEVYHKAQLDMLQLKFELLDSQQKSWEWGWS